MRHLEQQGIEDRRLPESAKQILLCMGNASANSPLIGK